jgi:hypothetical protein
MKLKIASADKDKVIEKKRRYSRFLEKRQAREAKGNKYMIGRRIWRAKKSQ